MCGPSKGQETAATQAANFSTQVQSQAGQVFGADNQVFQNLMKSYQSTVAAGPSQQGWNQAETNAVNSQIVDQAAANARNIKSAVGNDVAAIGGGNQVNPSGLETAVNLQTAESTEQAKSQQLQQATEANYEQGAKNYDTAVTGEEGLGNVFNSANGAVSGANEAIGQNMSAQNALTAASNWWEPIVGGAIGSVASGFSGGLSTQLGKNLATPSSNSGLTSVPS